MVCIHLSIQSTSPTPCTPFPAPHASPSFTRVRLTRLWSFPIPYPHAPSLTPPHSSSPPRLKVSHLQFGPGSATGPRDDPPTVSLLSCGHDGTCRVWRISLSNPARSHLVSVLNAAPPRTPLNTGASAGAGAGAGAGSSGSGSGGGVLREGDDLLLRCVPTAATFDPLFGRTVLGYTDGSLRVYNRQGDLFAQSSTSASTSTSSFSSLSGAGGVGAVSAPHSAPHSEGVSLVLAVPLLSEQSVNQQRGLSLAITLDQDAALSTTTTATTASSAAAAAAAATGGTGGDGDSVVDTVVGAVPVLELHEPTERHVRPRERKSARARGRETERERDRRRRREEEERCGHRKRPPRNTK